LGIPALRDRVAPEAVRRLWNPLFEPVFHPASFGFRQNRNCPMALEAVLELHRAGYSFVLDADIKGFFDNRSHQIILQNDLVGPVIEKPLDVGVQDKAVAGTVEFEHRLQSHRAIAVLAKAKRRRMEHGFKERIPKAANRLWSDPIAECGNAEGAKLRFICGDEYTSNDVGLHRFDETPLSPNDSAAHPNSWRG